MADPSSEVGGAGDPIAGRVALVTGASSGIGAASARALAAAGATAVGLCARREDRLREVLEDCRRHAPDSELFVVDLADVDGLGAFAARIERTLGRVDVLVNNAGVAKRRRIPDLTLDELRGVLDVNLLAPVALTNALLPGMIERGWGRIVNVSSMGTRSAALRVGAYAASKAALELWTEGLYLDLLGTGVRAQVLVPGTTATEFSRPTPDNEEPFPPDPNAQTPEDVAAALLALLRSEDFEGFASDAHAATSHAKRSDPNGFLAGIVPLLAPAVSPPAPGEPDPSR
ncbi:MAG TPA: SDR family NAD(P)-dependent oxidoreductase [Acidimicrobiia bacterium]|nr:SDR family NAD(P)-dependent oxidoreductase [Acidimicrobiia bacterium]